MKRLFWILTITALAAMAGAQDFYHRPSPFAGRTLLTLALFEEVRADIKTTADVNSKVDALVEKMGADVQGAFGDANGDFAAMRTAIDKINAKYDTEVLKLFTDDQAKRLKQTFIQYNGAGSLTQEWVQKDLTLTDEQKDKVKKAVAAQGEKMQQAFSGGGDDPMAAMKKIQDEFRADCEKVLTDDQKKKFKEMEGAKLEFKKIEGGGV